MQNAPFCLGDVGQPRMHFRSRLGQPVHLQHFSHQNICSILSLKVGGKMYGSGNSKPAPEVLELQPIEATPASFEEYGQVIEASPDGDEFGPQDAQLDLSRGVPRFYIMQLENRPLKISTITHHASVTQCLGSVGGHVWYLGIAKPSIVDGIEKDKDDTGRNILQSPCGHFYVPPAVEDVRVFRVAGTKFLKLNRGTWHAGPLFKDHTMAFYNLELSNTNVADHTTHNFICKNGVIFSIND